MALLFDGVDDFLLAGSNWELTADFEVAFRVKYTTVPAAGDVTFGLEVSGSGALIEFGYLAGTGIPASNGWRWFVRSSGAAVNVWEFQNGTLHDGNWHDVICWRSGTTIGVVIDKTAQTRANSGDSLGAGAFTPSVPMAFGARNNAGTRALWTDCTISDFRFFKRALSTAERNAFTDGGANDPTNPFVWYKTCSGAEGTNSGSEAVDATVTGATFTANPSNAASCSAAAVISPFYFMRSRRTAA